MFVSDVCRFPNDPRLEWGAGEAYRALGDGPRYVHWHGLYRRHWKGTSQLTLDQLG